MSRRSRSRRAFLLQDWYRYSTNPPTWKAVFSALLFNQGFLTVYLYRWTQWLSVERSTLRGKLVRRFNLALNVAELSPEADVGPGLLLVHPYGVGIGRGCKLGRDVTLYQGVSLGAKTLESEGGERRIDYPRLGNGVVLYPHVLAYGPVEIGDQAVVLGNSVVGTDLAPGATYGGIPAREIRQQGRRFSAEDLRSKVATERSEDDDTER